MGEWGEICIFANEMNLDIKILKGIDPIRIIIRDLRKRGIDLERLSNGLNEPREYLETVLSGKRRLTNQLTIKVERFMGYDSGSLLFLKRFYYQQETKIRSEAKLLSGRPNIRRILFWDTDFDKLDWTRYKKAIIERVNERGNLAERLEIARFYGLK